MINLLPNDYRLGLRFSRLNVRLGQWLALSLVIIGGLILTLGLGWLYMDQQIRSLNRSNAAAENQLKEQNLEGVKKQADEISQNIRIINQVLSRQVSFSSLMQEIGKVMPAGTVLNSLTLSEKVAGGVDLNANAKDSTAAAQIAVNLSDPKNNIFAQVDIVNVNCTQEAKEYPCTASLRALFDQKTAQRFLNVASGESR